VIAVGDGPTAVAFGEGAVWVTNADDRTVSRINPATGLADPKPIAANAVGRGIAVGGGSVWVTDESSRTVARIDPSSNSVAGTVPVGNGPSGIAFGAGAVWVANSLDGTVSRIDPASATVTGLVHVGGAPNGVAVGKQAVWVSAEFGERLVNIDPKTNPLRIAKSISIENRPKGVAVGEGGCWVAVQASGGGHRGGRLIVLIPDLGAIDPALARSNTDALVSTLVYDGLLAPRRTGGTDGTQLVPDLATNVPAPTDDGRTYTFHVRTGLRYSNGVPVRPGDFRRAFERAVRLNPDAFKSLGIVGSSACTQQRACDLSRGITIGTGTVTFRLAAPNPHFLLVGGGLAPVPPGTPIIHATAAKPPPGTGAYRVEDFVPSRVLTLVRNARFHVWAPAARPNGYPDEIAIRVTPSSWRGSKKPIDAIANGRADILLGGAPSDRVPELKARYPDQLHLVPQTATFFVYLNTKRPPFDDVRVRRALNFAVDREKIVALHGGADVAQLTCNTVPSVLPGYVRYCPYTVAPDTAEDWKAPDLERAKSLVAASDTRGGRVVVYTFPFLAKEGRYVASVLRDLGYRASVKELPDLTTYFATIAKVRPQAGLAGWIGFQLADDVFATLACGFSANWAAFCDRQIDAQVAQLRLEEAKNSAKAPRLAAQIDREVVDAAPWVPLFTPKFPDFVSKRVGNYQYNVFDSGVLLDQLWVR
jgi:peptide/nickel transport system substrate-binding protein